VLFKNTRMREGKKDPQAQGRATIAGVEYWVDAWTNEKNGERYQSLRFRAKEPKPQAEEAKPAEQQEAFDDEDASESLTPIVTLAHADDREIVELPLSVQQVEALIEQLPDVTLELHQFWHQRGTGPDTRAPVRKPPRLKPADPCPCCSGRRFSQCCGASASLN
jgi:hypothetical protein